MAHFMDLFDELERIHPSSYWREGATRRSPDRSPAADIHEIEDGYLIEVEVPGCGSDDVDVKVTDDLLRISGTKNRNEEGSVMRAERTQGDFARDFRLPRGIQSSDVSARVENGLLIVKVPKATTERTTRIEIK